MNDQEFNKFLHPLLIDRIVKLSTDVSRLRMEKRKDLHKHPSVIELKTILNLTDVVIDSNPAHPKFRLGKALGKEFTHWLRAKFLNRRRLFFRYSSNLSTIIYVWAGNHNTLRKEGSKRDVYLLFRKMLLNGYPADNFSELLLESSSRNRDLIDDFALFYALLEKKK